MIAPTLDAEAGAAIEQINARLGTAESTVAIRLEEILAAGEPASVAGVRLKSLRDGAVREIACDGVFIAIGHTPATKIFAGQVAVDAEGYVETVPGSTQTSVPGVFAAGDVQDKIWRQAVTAAGSGCMAALEAEKYLAELSADSALAAD